MILILIVTFIVAGLTLLTGFGLGTVLTPVFTFFYDVKLAVLMVAVVHFLNNLLKLTLFWKNVDLLIIRRFGLLSIVGALIGAFLQVFIYSGALKIFLGVVLILLGGREFERGLHRHRHPDRLFCRCRPYPDIPDFLS